ncbi:Ulp1 protease family protein [Nitzschia inconspicua]|uniref:Ulp1 protease family protein n=1 Tax=Nitzschia inconspicua TaxID=303405 RepID=A0A9K3KKY8_9STRA|nr:Ulp1 protease family protein [Nitzschia inconspicua]
MHAMLFVDDPVRGNPLRPTADAIRALDGEDWLSTILIDHLLQTTLKGCVPDHVLIGSSDCYSYFSTYNDKLDKHDCADAVQTMRGGLKAYAKSEFTVRYISAACHQGHYFVVDVTFDSRQPAIFQQQDYIVQQAVFRNCPKQNNSHDCGLFAIAVIWHLLEGKEIHSSVFTQDHIGALLYETGPEVEEPKEDEEVVAETHQENFIHDVEDEIFERKFSEPSQVFQTLVTTYIQLLCDYGGWRRLPRLVMVPTAPESECTKSHRGTFQCARQCFPCQGLNSALGNVFPANHNCYCAVHMRQNAESNHGKKFASMVTALSETTSLPEKRALLTQLQQKSPGAYKYVTDIDANRLMDSAWLEDEKLPPRYGFRNSNISESANNMFHDARNGNWLDAIDGILIKMSLRITKSQSEYEGKDGVVDNILGLATKRWENCVGCRVYASGNDGETYSVYQKLGGELEEEALLKVRPVDCVCDCGKWQAIGVPFVHGMAYFRHQMKWRLEDVLDQAVDEYYKYRTQRKLYRQNFVPVWRHLLEPDMMTLPPDGAARRMPVDRKW